MTNGPTFTITKQPVIMARKLNAKWTFGEIQTKIEVPATPLFDLIKEWYLSNHGIRVGFYGPNRVSEALEWCSEIFGSRFTYNTSKKSWSDDAFREELIKRVKNRNLEGEPTEKSNAYYGVDIEYELMNSLAAQISNEIDREILKQLGVSLEKPADYYFFFANKDDALLFKLTWGGEE